MVFGPFCKYGVSKFTHLFKGMFCHYWNTDIDCTDEFPDFVTPIFVGKTSSKHINTIFNGMVPNWNTIMGHNVIGTSD